MCFNAKVKLRGQLLWKAVMVLKYVTCLSVNDTWKYGETDHLLKLFKCSSVGGATVSMVSFQAVDTDSTPSRLTWNFVSSYKSMARHFTNSRWRLAAILFGCRFESLTKKSWRHIGTLQFLMQEKLLVTFLIILASCNIIPFRCLMLLGLLY